MRASRVVTAAARAFHWQYTGRLISGAPDAGRVDGNHARRRWQSTSSYIVPANAAPMARMRIFTRQPVAPYVKHATWRKTVQSSILQPSSSTGRHPSVSGPADMPIDVLKIEQLTRELLKALGEDADREGLLTTPERVAKLMEFLTSRYRTDVTALINGAIFTQTTNSMVIVKNIEVYSLCEHHMLPFFGRCHIGYIPTGRVFGVSKLARLVDMFARRLQLQERLTEQISQAVFESIDARGVGVMIEARHLCMMMRGVEKQNSEMVTSSVLGTFRDSETTRDEFLALIGPRGR